MEQKGIVYLVGAGPGNCGLITVRGEELLKEAEVVVYDRLVGEDILKLASWDALKINVGKTSGVHPVPQKEINHILIKEARLGKRVVRLKGGDGFLFGRGGEELEALCKEGITFEVVPGITSALAAPAFAGIPVTHRNFASSVSIITGHRRENEKLKLDFEALVRLKGTLVFMMSVANIKEIADSLIDAGMDPETPCAVVENGTLSLQRKLISNLEKIEQDVLKKNVKSPAVFVVGTVCTLSNRFDWYSKLPLKGLSFLVTSPKANSGRMVKGLREAGANVLMAPMIKTVPVSFEIPDLSIYTGIIFTSSFAVSTFFDKLFSSGMDARSLKRNRIFCVGKETAKSLLSYGIIADYVPKSYSGENLAKQLCQNGIVSTDDRLLWPRAETVSPSLAMIIKDAGIFLHEMVIYSTQEEKGNVPADFDYAVFTSSSSVKNLCSKLGEGYDFGKIKALCIGRQTADTAKKSGMKTYVSPIATIPEMLKWIKDLCKNN